MKRMKTLLTCCLAGWFVLPLGGCLYQMKHEFPDGTYFNRQRDATVTRKIDDSQMKNYLLAGLAPWSDFGSKDLVDVSAHEEHLSGVKVETTFNVLDTIIWVVPGFAYGIYVWAPRHVGVKGDVIEGKVAAVPAAR